jgi:hypothetical protein
VHIELDNLVGMLAWPRLRFRGTHTEEGEVNHPVLGKMARIAVVPHFEIVK